MVSSPMMRRRMMGGSTWHSVDHVCRSCFTSCTPALASSSSPSPPLEGWRSLAHYPPWTNTDAPSNHAGERGVMASVLRQEEGRQLLEEIQREKKEREMEKKHHSSSHDALPQGLGSMASARPASFHGWDTAMAATWNTAQEASLSTAPSSVPLPFSPSSLHASSAPFSGRRPGRRAVQYSGVQREILSLYRAFLKSIKGLQDEETRENLRVHVREKFSEGAALPKRKRDVIEWRLNYGKRKLEELDRLGKHSTFRFVT